MEERKGFGSNFGFLMAAVGSAVGLGNIWGFPNKMGACGGFTFLIIYLIFLIYVNKNDDGTGDFSRIRKDSFYWYKKVIESCGEEL